MDSGGLVVRRFSIYYPRSTIYVTVLRAHVGSNFLVSAATYASVHSVVRVGKSDLLKVKGRTQTIQVYEILGLKEREP